MLSRGSVWNSSLNSWTQDCSVWNGPPNTVRHKITLFETVHWIQTQNYSVWNGQLNTIRHQMTVSKTVNWIQSDTRLLCLKQTTEYNRTQDYSETVHWTQSDAILLSAKLVEVNLQREQATHDSTHHLSHAEQTAIFHLQTGHCGLKAHMEKYW